MPRRFQIFIVVSLLTLIADQLTKWWARAELADLGYKGHTVVPGYFDLRLSYNTGSAFGLFSSMDGARVFLSLVGGIALVAIILILRKTPDAHTWLIVALALVAGGAVGNVVDRLIAGKVTDFVVWKIGSKEWPAFNIADSALCVGVAIMFLDIGRESKSKNAKTAKAEAERATP